MSAVNANEKVQPVDGASAQPHDLVTDPSLIEPETEYTNPTLKALALAFPNHGNDDQNPDDEGE